MTGDNALFREVGKAQYALVGSALVLLHSGIRVLYAAGGSGETALALTAVLDPARLVLTSVVQMAAYLVLPGAVGFAMLGLARGGHRLPGAIFGVLLFVVAAIFGSFVMAVLMVIGTAFIILTMGRFRRLDEIADRPLTLWLAVTLASFLYIGSALMPLRPLEIIEVGGQSSFVGRVYGQDGTWQVVQKGALGPVSYVEEGTLASREICQPAFNVLTGTVSDLFRSSGYRSCP